MPPTSYGLPSSFPMCHNATGCPCPFRLASRSDRGALQLGCGGVQSHGLCGVCRGVGLRQLHPFPAHEHPSAHSQPTVTSLPFTPPPLTPSPHFTLPSPALPSPPFLHCCGGVVCGDDMFLVCFQLCRSEPNSCHSLLWPIST